MIPTPVNRGAVAHRERHRDPAPAGLQPLVAEQRESVHGRSRRVRSARRCSCSARRRLRPGRRSTFVAIARPISDRQRDQHQRDDARRPADQPPEVVERLPLLHRREQLRSRGAAVRPARSGRSSRRRRRRRRSHRHARPARSARPSGPEQQRHLRERLGLERARAECGDSDQPGPRGRAGARVEQVMGEASLGVAPDADVEARRGDPPASDADRADRTSR